MRLSNEGAAFIARHEGFVSKAYRDPVGIWTIGTGFTNRSRVFSEYWRKLHGRAMRAGDTITPAQNAVILQKAADEEYGAAVNRHISPRKQHEYDGATSVCFNCGPGAAKWKWAKALARGDVHLAATLLKSTAITAGGKRLRGLVRRRREEAALIEHGDYGNAGYPRGMVGKTTRNGEEAETLRDYQAKLKKLGFDPGPIDGAFGPKSKAAVLAFQKKHPDLVNDGVLGRATMAQIDRSIAKRNTPVKATVAVTAIAGAAAATPDRLYESGVLWAIGAAFVVGILFASYLLWKHRKDL